MLDLPAPRKPISRQITGEEFEYLCAFRRKDKPQPVRAVSAEHAARKFRLANHRGGEVQVLVATRAMRARREFYVYSLRSDLGKSRVLRPGA